MIESTISDPNGCSFTRELLPHIRDNTKKVEILWTKPPGDGPFPAVLFIHGYQKKPRKGAEKSLGSGRLGEMAEKGYVTAAMSQPGYGNSDGLPDYCGPFSQEAALAAIKFLRRQRFIIPEKIGLWGSSRGAIVAGMVATLDNALAALVLAAGVYDFFPWFRMLRDEELDEELIENITKEAGISDESFRARSCIYHVKKIKTPVLLLHSNSDKIIPVIQAQAFAEELERNGIKVRLFIIPGADHDIWSEDQSEKIYPFLKEHLA